MVLHDAVENDPYFSPKRLFNEFGSDVTKLVLPLRKPDYRLMQGNSVDEQKRVRDLLYFEQIWSTQADAQLLKLSDRWHNFATIHNAPDPDKIRRYIDVTAQYYLQLAYHRSAWHAQKMEDRLRLLDAAGFRNAA
jgi:(p)ppGpp synthase/HD superfamily hydrolase